MDAAKVAKLIIDLILILAVGGLFGYALQKLLKVPSLIGYMIVGFILGPEVIKFLTTESGALPHYKVITSIALGLVILKAGINTNFKTLKKVGKKSIMLGTLPASFEIGIISFFAYFVLRWGGWESLLLGTLIAAVSPAVVIPEVLKIKKEGYDDKTTTMTSIGASLDDVFVITLFAIFFSFASNMTEPLYMIPIKIVVGILAGGIIGAVLKVSLVKFSGYVSGLVLVATTVVIMLLNIPFVEPILFVLAMGLSYRNFSLPSKFQSAEDCEKTLEKELVNWSWLVAKTPLFSLVGALVSLRVIGAEWYIGIAILMLGIGFRLFGISIVTRGDEMDEGQKRFVMFANIPKATVQASVGALPLMAGIFYGEEMLAFSTLAILLTAPVGSILIANYGRKLLKKER